MTMVELLNTFRLLKRHCNCRVAHFRAAGLLSTSFLFGFREILPLHAVCIRIAASSLVYFLFDRGKSNPHFDDNAL